MKKSMCRCFVNLGLMFIIMGSCAVNGSVDKGADKNKSLATNCGDPAHCGKLAAVVVKNDIIAHAGETVSIDGLPSTGGKELSYSWKQTSGMEMKIDGSIYPVVSFSAPVVDSEKKLEFQLTVSDGKASASTKATVTIKPFLVKATASPLTLRTGDTATLKAEVTEDSGMSHLYLWKIVSDGGAKLELVHAHSQTATLKVSGKVKTKTSVICEVSAFNPFGATQKDIVNLKVTPN